MDKKQSFINLVTDCFNKEIIKKLVFSRPRSSETARVSGRLCAHRGRKILALEFSLPGNTVSHKNVGKDELPLVLAELTEEYRQANLITQLGDVEYKTSDSGKEALLGADKLSRRILGEPPVFESAICELDNRKNRFFQGNEDFLIALGISDKNGRVHDKRQGKFRQICRFIELIDDIYDKLPEKDELLIYDLCCGKSYLSFAVYYYFTKVKSRRITMLGIDLKRDVIEWCDRLAKSLGNEGMKFIYGDISENTPMNISPDMVISLHACDIATDIVIDRATALGAKIILSTPCCHRYLNDRINAEPLKFVTDYPQLRGKLCEAITDAIRLSRLSAAGYEVTALELTDPDDTPKNTLLRAIRRENVSSEVLEKRRSEYEKILSFLLGDGVKDYLKEIKQ